MHCELTVDAPEGSVAPIHVSLKFPLAHFIAFHEVPQKKKAKQDRKQQTLAGQCVGGMTVVAERVPGSLSMTGSDQKRSPAGLQHQAV